MLSKVRVRLVDVPVALFRASELHTNDLLREIALVAAANPGLEHGHLFGDLLTAADTYAHRPVSVARRVAESVTAAARAGWDTVTVDFDADAGAADAVLHWAELLATCDTMASQERLLTLPAGDDLRAFRAWYVREIVEQVRTGREPVPWGARDRIAVGAAP